MRLARTLFTGRISSGIFNRGYAVKPTISLISEIRKETEVSISKAKEALIATENNLENALEWIAEDLSKSGAAKAAKLAGRVASEGLVGVITRNNIPGASHGALVEQLVRNVASAALNIPENVLDIQDGVSSIPTELLIETKLAENNLSVKDAVFETICKLGENIQLRRAITTRFSFSGSSSIYTASAVHGGEADCGKIGGLVVLQLENSFFTDPSLQLAQQLSKHVVGMNPQYLDTSDTRVKEKLSNIPPAELQDFMTNSILLNQAFLFGQGSVQERLEEFKKTHGVAMTIKTFNRLVAGEGVDKVISQDFHTEVMKQMEKSNNL